MSFSFRFMSKSVFHSLLLEINSVKVQKEIDKGSGSGLRFPLLFLHSLNKGSGFTISLLFRTLLEYLVQILSFSSGNIGEGRRRV